MIPDFYLINVIREYHGSKSLVNNRLWVVKDLNKVASVYNSWFYIRWQICRQQPLSLSLSLSLSLRKKFIVNPVWNVLNIFYWYHLDAKNCLWPLRREFSPDFIPVLANGPKKIFPFLTKSLYESQWMFKHNSHPKADCIIFYNYVWLLNYMKYQLLFYSSFNKRRILKMCFFHWKTACKGISSVPLGQSLWWTFGN